MADLIIVTENARLIDLDKLPGGRELYERLADAFLDAYHGYSTSENLGDRGVAQTSRATDGAEG